MRILGFSKKWAKLNNRSFTTFRFPRKDRDWQLGEQVQIVFKPRSKEREVLGIAEIWAKEERWMSGVTSKEARRDGFDNYGDMLLWVFRVHDLRFYDEPMNKLTLKWLNRRKNGKK